ncbi:MAG: hypothetical protein GC160_21065 [Acidobacteria bacterium]|nr:hypothetical protein [Acidobacteriota bacterium]
MLFIPPTLPGRRSGALTALLLLGLAAATDTATAEVRKPTAVDFAEPVAPVDGLSAEDWRQVRSLYEQHRHRAAQQPDGSHVARNPQQRWRIRFDGRGFAVRPDEGDWSWGLELVGFGLEGAERTIAGPAEEVTTEAGRVAYERGPGLQEWFVNDRRGLQQGWTVRRRPAGSGRRLTFVLAVQGALRPRLVDQTGSGVEFADESGVGVVRYAGLAAWDADGRALPAEMSVRAAGGLVISVDDSGALYPVTVDPVAVQRAYIKASNPDDSDYFGSPVALSGDTLAVGADGEDGYGWGNNPQADNSVSSSGAVYVFRRTAGTWRQEAYLKSTYPDASDFFGQSLALSGDVLAVGAPGEDSPGTGVNSLPGPSANSVADSGAVYVFMRGERYGWGRGAHIKASNAEAGDQFGSAVALSGNTLVVGAHLEDSNATGVNSSSQSNNSAASSGAVYVFTLNGEVWSQQAYIKASNTEGSDFFGISVALSGDTLAVGASLEDSAAGEADNSAADSGAVYVFTRTGSSWSQQAYLKASNPGASDLFGRSVALSGDALAVGAPGEAGGGAGVNPGSQADDSMPNSGAAYIFARIGSAWTQQAYVKASNTDAGDRFGWSVAVSGQAVAVGAYQEDSGGLGVNPSSELDNTAAGSGATYLFTQQAGEWSQAAYFKASNTDAGDQFGWSVALAGDTLASAAHLEDSNAVGVNAESQSDNSVQDSGAVYSFALCSSLTVTTTLTKITGITPSPAVVGEPYSVSYTVENACGEVILGSVEISDGTDSNTCSVAAGSCVLTSTTQGAKPITASYLGEGNFAPSSTIADHDVKWPTTISIDSISPSPSLPGQPYTVSYTVTSAGGTPTGEVRVSDGTATNICPAAGGLCSLTSTTPGAKTITASYLGDASPTVGPTVTTLVTCLSATQHVETTVTDPELCTVDFGSESEVTFADASGRLEVKDFGVSGSWTQHVQANFDHPIPPQPDFVWVTSTVDASVVVWPEGAGLGRLDVSCQSYQSGYTISGTPQVRIYQKGFFDLTFDHEWWESPQRILWLTQQVPFSRSRPIHIEFASTLSMFRQGYGDESSSLTADLSVSAKDSVGDLVSLLSEPEPSEGYFTDSDFAPTSTTAAHTVNPAPTMTTIGVISPAPSTVGQPYTIPFTVTSGSGTPTGNVTVSDGSASNACPVADGVCSLTSTTAGAKVVTATYLGDGFFAPSADAAALTVGPAATTTSILEINPSPSKVDHAYTVSYSVTAAGGPPPGDVVVSDGAASNACPVAAGGCTLTSTTLGAKTISVTYAGDANFTGSSDSQPHIVLPEMVAADKVGVYRVGRWLLDANGNGATDPGADLDFFLGWPAATPVVGDWNGDGRKKVGVFASGFWFLDYDGDGVFNPSPGGPDKQYAFGWAGVTPVVGDWNGDGRDSVGVHSNGFWFLDYDGDTLWDAGVADKVFGFGGWTGVELMIGDWNGDGRDKLGLYSNGFWFLDYDGSYSWDGGVTDKIFGFGWTGAKPIVGDWNGDGRDSVAVHSAGFWFFDYDGDTLWNPSPGGQDRIFGLGGWTGAEPVIGDWNGDGRQSAGIFSSGTWFLDFDADGAWDSAVDLAVPWGKAGDVPFVGAW